MASEQAQTTAAAHAAPDDAAPQPGPVPAAPSSPPAQKAVGGVMGKIYEQCASRRLRAGVDAATYERIWQAFNEVMLENIKKRTSIKVSGIFKLVVNRTYEGGERRLDRKMAFPASRLITPNGHPNVDMQLILADRFKDSYALTEGTRTKKQEASDVEAGLEQRLGALRKEEAELKAQAPKAPRLLEVWAEIRAVSEELQDERERLQGKWLRGISLMGSNQAEWASMREMSYLEIGAAVGLDKAVAEAAVLDIWHQFGASCNAPASSLKGQAATTYLRALPAAPSNRGTQELLLACGRLVVKNGKYSFVPKPVQADSIPGKDCLALPPKGPRVQGHDGKAAAARPTTSASASKMVARGMTPLIAVSRNRSAPSKGSGAPPPSLTVQTDAAAAAAAAPLAASRHSGRSGGGGGGDGGKPKVGPAIMKRPMTQARQSPHVTGHTHGYMAKTMNEIPPPQSPLGVANGRPWSAARPAMDGALKQQVQDAFFSSALQPKPGTRGGDAGKDGAAATGRGGDAVDAPGAAEARPRTHASVSTAGSKHRRRHHRDGSVTVRSTKEAGAQVLKLAEEEEGLDHARSANLEKARLRYLSEVARAQDMAHKQDAEIQERRRQAEYALAVQKQMRDELARQRFDFLQVQAQAKQAHQRREKEFRMAPTTLYPAAIPHGRSALWTDQYNRDVAAMIRDDYLTEIDHKKRLRQQEKDKQVKQERAMLEQIAEGMVLDHVAQQAHKVGMRKELLNELENSKFAHSVPFDSIRPCVN